MKKTLVAVLFAFLFMGYTCSSTDVAALIEKVQSITSSTCAYVPTAQTIIAIFESSNQQLKTAADVAAAICAALKQPPTSGGTDSVKVEGVPLSGYRVAR